MKKIFVDIYLAFNLGDDLFLDILANKYPDTEFTVNYVGNNYDSFISNYSNVRRRKYNLKDKVLQKIKIKNTLTDYKTIAENYDGIVFIGGSIFRDEEYHEELYKDRMKLILEFKVLNKPIFVLGANFGPYKSEKFISDYRKFFQMCTDVCFRDKFSYDLFNDMDNVRYAPDIVFQLDVDKYKKNIKKDIIGFSIIDVKHKDSLGCYEEEYIESNVRAIERFIDEGYCCCLMSFCKKEGDFNAIKKILSKMRMTSRSKVIIYEYNGKLYEAINKISEFKLFVSARFHGNILSQLLRVPVLPVIYSFKTENMLKDINLDSIMIKMNDLKMLEDKEVMKKSYSNITEVENIIEGSKRQFERLSLFLE